LDYRKTSYQPKAAARRNASAAFSFKVNQHRGLSAGISYPNQP